MQLEYLALMKYRLEKAKADLCVAKENLGSDRYAQAANRAYYAMFHATRALLAPYQLDSKRHSTIIGMFNKHFVATKKIDPAYNIMLATAFQTRLKCDYDDYYLIAKIDAATQVDNADKFLAMIELWIKANLD
ncbi:MAG: HEPN domain-containing protein [Bacillota bacterium]